MPLRFIVFIIHLRIVHYIPLGETHRDVGEERGPVGHLCCKLGWTGDDTLSKMIRYKSETGSEVYLVQL